LIWSEKHLRKLADRRAIYSLGQA